MIFEIKEKDNILLENGKQFVILKTFDFENKTYSVLAEVTSSPKEDPLTAIIDVDASCVTQKLTPVEDLDLLVKLKNYLLNIIKQKKQQ